jgi:hypothetical protein
VGLTRRLNRPPPGLKHQSASVAAGSRLTSLVSLAQGHTLRENSFDHVVFGVSDYAASKSVLPQGTRTARRSCCPEGPLGVELSPPEGKASLCMCQTEEKPAHLHLAFTAENRRQVEAFYRAALEAGGKDNGAPVCARTTTRTTMQLSSLVRTGTTSKWFATNPRSNPSIEGRPQAGFAHLRPPLMSNVRRRNPSSTDR